MALDNHSLLVFIALITTSVELLVVERVSQNLTAVPNDIDPDVTILTLAWNSITRIEDKDMSGLPRLETLSISYNQIKSISVKAFVNNTNLVALILNHNPISNLTLGYIPSLRNLYVKGCKLKIFPDLSGTPNLELVQLNINNFTQIPKASINGLTKLRTLAFRQCDVRYLPDLSDLVSLEELVIINNAMTSLPDLYHLPLTRVAWYDNPVVCNRSLCWVRMWSYMKPGISDLENAVCAAPSEVSGLPLMGVHPVDMKCFDGKCLPQYRVQNGAFFVWRFIIWI